MVDLLDSPVVGVDQDLVDAAAAVARNYCHWHVAPSVEETITLEASFTRSLILPSLYVTEVGMIVEDGGEVPPDTYSLRRNGILRRLNGFWTWDVTVTFTHGFQACPADLAAVVAGMARNGASPRTPGTVRVGEVSVTTSASQSGTALDDSSLAVLDAYRLVL